MRDTGYCRYCGATLKVGGLTSDSKRGAENTFFSVALYNFKKRGRGEGVDSAHPPPRALH